MKSCCELISPEKNTHTVFNIGIVTLIIIISNIHSPLAPNICWQAAHLQLLLLQVPELELALQAVDSLTSKVFNKAFISVPLCQVGSFAFVIFFSHCNRQGKTLYCIMDEQKHLVRS